MTHIALAATAVAAIAVGCERHTALHIFLDNRTPTSFSFSGDALAGDFEVLELPRPTPLSKVDPYAFKGETIWKIAAPARTKADEWPKVTYAELPNGFSQIFPERVPPPKLAEGKLYVARIVAGKDSQSALFFEIHNGKPVNVTDEVFGP